MAFPLAILLCFVVECKQQSEEVRDVKDTFIFSENEYKAHLKFLADDLLEGRAPGARGGDLAALHIASQFEAAGLQPISEEDGYFQQVPLMEVNTDYDPLDFKLRSHEESKALTPLKDIFLFSELPQEEIHLEEELVFVGYGIDASEYGWDDFKGVDVKGKILLMIFGTPDYGQTGFGTESLTYYHMNRFKRDITRLKDAKGLIMIHSDELADQSDEVPDRPFSFYEVDYIPWYFQNYKPMKRLYVYGVISQPAIDASLSHLGLGFEQLKQKADRRDFRPFPLGLKAEIDFKHKSLKFTSPNVIGLLPGSSSEDEAVIYTAHYDHLGISRPVNGDSIYHGARDNASGTAALLCLAHAMASRPPAKRSVIFLALTGEEGGMLGSQYYVFNPILPLEKTIIGINMDAYYFFGRQDGFEMFPAQYTNAVPTMQILGKELGLEFDYGGVDRGGMAFRSGHDTLCTRGVVAIKK